ncbi:MAG TPA: PLDc N-terminal domain-containing protein, partial [Ideonella sp.]|nr:PLDc N-terminal domain-containing protein [Ideonella sp.]
MSGTNGGWGIALSTHGLAVVASLLTYVLTTRASQYRRPPSIAIAWVLGLVALPYLVLPVYLMFGRRKLVRRHAPPYAQRPAPRHWARALVESFGLPDASPARVRLHADGAAARDALFATIERAERRLDVCTFLIGDDAFGREAASRLIARARAGVRVRLMIDGVGAL